MNCAECNSYSPITLYLETDGCEVALCSRCYRAGSHASTQPSDMSSMISERKPMRSAGIRGSHADAFKAFHDAHPSVYATLVRMALAEKRAGRKRIGMKRLFETFRWETSQRGGDDFKLNNNFAPYYARLIMSRERELIGVFETREMR